MRHFDYKKFFPREHWVPIGSKIFTKLKNESVTICGIPSCGKRFFIRHIHEYYKSVTKDDRTIIVPLEIVPHKSQIDSVSSRILCILRSTLDHPKYLEELTCEEAISKLVKLDKKILFIINYFERLKRDKGTMIFLESLRTTDQLKIRFLISCDISCLTKPRTYCEAGILTNSNTFILHPFSKDKVRKIIKINNKIYNWKVPLKWSDEIYTLSGGIVGLVKYISKFIHENNPSSLSIEQLIRNPGIRYKITNIYNTLEVNGLVKNKKVNLEKSKLLKDIGVINKDKSLRIQLLRPFLSKAEPKIQNQDLYKLLTPQEFNLFKVFHSNFGRILLLDEISKQLWGEYASKKYSLWSIYKIIVNLRKKIKKIGFTIKNYRGRGYVLTKLNN